MKSKSKKKSYVIRVRAIITKDYEVEAEHQKEACEIATSRFVTTCEEGVQEKYEQHVVQVREGKFNE